MNWKFWDKPPAPAEKKAEPAKKVRIYPMMASQVTPQKKGVVKNPFEPAKPMNGVLPSNVSAMAMDSAMSDYSGYGAGYGGAAAAGASGMFFIGYPALAELTQRAEYRLISETIAQEMTRKWVRLQAMGKESKNDKIKALVAALKRYKVRDAFRRAAELDGFFGRAHIYLDTGHTDDPDELKIKLAMIPEKIGIGSLRAVKVVEPMWTYPAQYNSTNPLLDDFYKPMSWYVMGVEIHCSRFLTFVGREMPDMLKPAYMFGGLSRTQMAQECVDFWLRDRDSVSDLVTNFSTPVLETDMAVSLQQPLGNGATLADPCVGGPGSGLFERVDVFSNFKSNRGTFVTNFGTENFKIEAVPLGTLDKLQAQSQEHVAAVSKLPLLKYAGLTPAGLNATSEPELKSFQDDIHAQQEDFFADNFEYVIKVIQLSEFGEIDPEITFEFVSLWTLDDAGKAAVQKIKADIDAVNIEAGVISPEEARERISTDQESQYMGLDLSSPPPPVPTDEGHMDLDDDATRIADQGAGGNESGANSGE